MGVVNDRRGVPEDGVREKDRADGYTYDL